MSRHQAVRTGAGAQQPGTAPSPSPHPRHRRRGDRGSATVWVVALMGLLCAAFAGVLLLGNAMAVRHRAGGAADLAALAAADHALDGEAAACAHAARVAAAQGARLVSCAVRGEVSDVIVRVEAARVRSRAGPASGP